MPGVGATDRPRVSIAGGRFVVAASGTADGPSQALSRYLVDHGAEAVWVVTHPLVSEAPPEHRLDELVSGTERIYRRPNHPPLTFALDPVTPLRLPPADAWFGFNCLVTAQGLLRRRLGRVGRVVHWSVDYVPNRFGNSPLTSVYDRLDRWCVLSSDGRVELSAAALAERLSAYELDVDRAPAEIVPMGAWTDEAPSTSAAALTTPRLVFLGHLVDRMGVPLFLALVGELRQRGIDVEADIIGGGPLLEALRREAQALGLEEHVVFHGFVAEFGDVQQLLARAAIAVAPYDTDPASFSRFADPGKLKAYLAAGLPILLTRVPPNAAELASHGGAMVLEPEADQFADAAARLLADPDEWQRRHRAAQAYAKRFDWGSMLADVLPRLGVDISARTP